MKADSNLNLLKVPVDINLLYISFLNVESVIQFLKTSQTAKGLIDNPQFQFWRRRITQDFSLPTEDILQHPRDLPHKVIYQRLYQYSMPNRPSKYPVDLFLCASYAIEEKNINRLWTEWLINVAPLDQQPALIEYIFSRLILQDLDWTKKLIEKVEEKSQVQINFNSLVLEYAISSGKPPTVQWLLSRTLNVWKPVFTEYRLRLAARCADSNILRCCLEAKGDTLDIENLRYRLNWALRFYNKEELIRVISLAALMRINVRTLLYDVSLMRAAADSDNLEILNWFFSAAQTNEQPIVIDDLLLGPIAQSNSLKVLQFFISKSKPEVINQNVLECAVQSGDIKKVEYLRLKAPEIKLDVSALTYSIGLKNTEMFQWLLPKVYGEPEQFTDHILNHLIYIAVDGKDLEILKIVLSIAAQNHSLQALDVRSCLSVATRHEDIEALKLLLPLASSSLDNQPLVNYLKEDEILEDIASSGDPQIFRLFITQFPDLWSNQGSAKKLLKYAAESGYLEFMQFFMATQELRPKVSHLSTALAIGHLAMAQWLLQQLKHIDVTPTSEQFLQMEEDAKDRGHFAVSQWAATERKNAVSIAQSSHTLLSSQTTSRNISEHKVNSQANIAKIG